MSDLLNADVITSASTSNLGILSLMILVLGVIALAFFRDAPHWIRLVAFGLLFSGVVGFAGALIKHEPEPRPPIAKIESEEAEPDQATEEEVTLNESFSYSGVTNCNGQRDAAKAEEVCRTSASSYVQTNQRTLISVEPQNISSSISHDREPLPSNARSCRSSGSVECKLRVQ